MFESLHPAVFGGAAALLILIVLIPLLRLRRRRLEYRYYRFVDENSRALEEQIAINRRYVFADAKPIPISHVYDNKTIFVSVACRDYLIYKLEYDRAFCEQFLSRSGACSDGKIAAYQRELAAIKSFGQFKADPGRLKRTRLCEIERSRFSSRTKRPSAAIACTVTLFCRALSGKPLGKKEETFRLSEILQLIRRLCDKNGDFYNDREIWDALCRVERSRVTNRLRFAIYERDGYRCRNCGKTGSEASLEIDHVFPVSKGGKSTPDNLQTLCRECNRRKGDRV